MTQQMLDDRYGRSARRRWPWIVLGAVAAAVVVAFGWSIVAQNLDAVNGDATAFEIRDDRTVQVSFQVSAPTDRAFACAIEALDTEHGTVGWRVVEYPGTDAHTQAFTESVPTIARATTGLINACWVT